MGAIFTVATLLAGPIGCYNLDDAGLPRRQIDVTINDTEWSVSYLVAGDPRDPRIVYVHGTPSSASTMRDYLLEPEPGFEHVSYDRPGFGETTPLAPLTSFEEQARILEALLVTRDGRGTILVGHSLGGPIVAQAAAMYPEQIAGLVIISGSLDPELERLRWYNHVCEWLLVRWALPRSLRNSNAEVLDAKQETQRLAPLLSQITCPVLIIHGERDRLVPVENVDYMLEFMTNAHVEVMIIDGGNHFIPWTEGEVIRQGIRRLIDMTRPTADP